MLNILGYIVLENIIVFFIGMLLGNIIMTVTCNITKKRCFKFSKRIIIEVCLGILLLIIYNSFNTYGFLGMPRNLVTAKVIEMVAIPFVIAFMYILTVLDIEKGYIDKKVMLFGISVVLLSIITEVIMHINMYRVDNVHVLIYMIYVCIIILLTLVQMESIKKNEKAIYVVDQVIYILTLAMFMGSFVMIVSIFVSIIIYIIAELFAKDKNELKTREISRTKIPYTPIITVVSIIVYILYNYYMSYMVVF